jgi:predicted GTPase
VLSGPLYPDGIPIVPEEDLERWIGERAVEEVVFSYSDVSNEYVERMKARVEATGAAFRTFDPTASLIRGSKPCVAVCAVRTGCGKSPVSRYVTRTLREQGLRVAVIRHPMPYGDLSKQIVQRFATLDDLEKHDCTIEEMEEYEPHVSAGDVVFAGADYQKVLDAAEAEADVILWDGGNNDAPFVAPDLQITLLDPLRAGDELLYFPSRWNLEHADVLLVTKVGEASAAGLETVRANAAAHNPEAALLHGRLPIRLADEAAVRDKRVLVVEDGPTVTHGGMGFGAGLLAAERAGAAQIVDPRPHAKGQIAAAFENYPHIRNVLPALGYGDEQIADMQATIADVPCDVVVVGTPIDLSRIVKIDKPHVRVRYDFEDADEPGLRDLLLARLRAKA